MTYLDEAYRRFKLPIMVSFSPSYRKTSDGYFTVNHMQHNGTFIREYSECPLDAKSDYLAAVKELSQ